MVVRNHIKLIEIHFADGDCLFLHRITNPNTHKHEANHQESWLKMLRGHIEDIQKEINEIEEARS